MNSNSFERPRVILIFHEWWALRATPQYVLDSSDIVESCKDFIHCTLFGFDCISSFITHSLAWAFYYACPYLLALSKIHGSICNLTLHQYLHWFFTWWLCSEETVLGGWAEIFPKLLFFSVFSHLIHLIEWMPFVEKKVFVVLFFPLWNCSSFLGHCLWWTLECFNEFLWTLPRVWAHLVFVTHTVCTVCCSPPLTSLRRGSLGYLVLLNHYML